MPSQHCQPTTSYGGSTQWVRVNVQMALHKTLLQCQQCQIRSRHDMRLKAVDWCSPNSSNTEPYGSQSTLVDDDEMHTSILLRSCLPGTCRWLHFVHLSRILFSGLIAQGCRGVSSSKYLEGRCTLRDPSAATSAAGSRPFSLRHVC